MISRARAGIVHWSPPREAIASRPAMLAITPRSLSSRGQARAPRIAFLYKRRPRASRALVSQEAARSALDDPSTHGYGEKIRRGSESRHATTREREREKEKEKEKEKI